jgi:hypothetical protein
MLEYKDSRKFRNGNFVLPVHFQTEISDAELSKILRKLDRLDFVRQKESRDFIGSARSKTGISFNRLSIKSGDDVAIQIDYLLSDYDREEFEEYAKAIAILKRLFTFQPKSAFATNCTNEH